MFNGLARSFAFKKGRNSGKCSGREAAEAMAKEAKKNDLILRTSGSLNVDGSNNFASVFSKKGQKGVNQDCCIVWEVCLEHWQSNENFNCCIRFNDTFSFSMLEIKWGILTYNIIVVGIWMPRRHDLLWDF